MPRPSKPMPRFKSWFWEKNDCEVEKARSNPVIGMMAGVLSTPGGGVGGDNVAGGVRTASVGVGDESGGTTVTPGGEVSVGVSVGSGPVSVGVWVGSVPVAVGSGVSDGPGISVMTVVSVGLTAIMVCVGVGSSTVGVDVGVSCSGVAVHTQHFGVELGTMVNSARGVFVHMGVMVFVPSKVGRGVSVMHSVAIISACESRFAALAGMFT
jgi:hypothetical protein